ncbi:MAG: hypothetical protein EOP21_13065 [Hyphomicrobiales bacterium]|nr:MAG: hypothetical protein EOP21_13065 [Hyphomicrobiales bacterium]
MAEPTLTDRWLTRLKNNPIVAVLIISGISLAAVFSFWGQLPPGVREWAGGRLAPSSEESSAPEMGWVFAGYADKANELVWASPARIRLVNASGGSDRPHMFRVGDVVQPIEPVHQVIANYRTAGTLHQMTPPWEITEVIRTKEDWTGRIYGTDIQLEVLDVTVSQLPDSDWAIWLRVKPTGIGR